MQFAKRCPLHGEIVRQSLWLRRHQTVDFANDKPSFIAERAVLEDKDILFVCLHNIKICLKTVDHVLYFMSCTDSIQYEQFF